MENKKSPKELQKAYVSFLSIFSNCLNKPYTSSELKNEAKLKKSTIGMQSFSGEILPRLKDISLVLQIHKSDKNIILLRKLFNIRWIDQRTNNYFFLTPRTSKIKITFKKFIREFGEYIKERELVEKIVEALILQLQNYELLIKNFEGLLKLENNSSNKKDFLMPIHKHDKKTGKPILLNKDDIKKYNFFQIIYAEKDGKSIPLEKLFKTGVNKKKIKIMHLNWELTKNITHVLLIEEKDEFYLPLSINLVSIIGNIANMVVLLGQYTNVQINVQNVLENKFRET
jgi:hypothetical protein